ncbi:hypothetical protein OQZ33_22750 [Pedobacter sp. MC2016-05]|uniref:hypothetical protein n=1 Tax=Pedobacter sp. MC2016-05 TaxID=2994474 RepID=UPI0022458958|nr:hypothetical protein [Pedobacter sp. MC2016-05]MCX2477171.1 hypothetical protein [Pedobacter sp. MC2016-05]
MILKLCDLEVSGFSQLVGKSESHIYGVVNGSRPLSNSFANQIGAILNFDSGVIFNLNRPLPSLLESDKLIDFRRKYSNNLEYFISKRNEQSIDFFLVNVLIPSEFMEDKRSVSEIRIHSREVYKKEFSSEELSKGLRYAVKKGHLKTTKKEIVKSSGTKGIRMVDVFWS